MGAEIIKVEPPLLGDPFRRTGGPNLKGESFHFLYTNRSKKSIELNLRAPSSLAAFKDLVRVSDVVLNNFRPGVMKRLGLDHRIVRHARRILFQSWLRRQCTGSYLPPFWVA